jgi:hypothetical protein
VDNLIKWKRFIVDWCRMCKRNSEPVDHLLLHCSVAKELWAFVFVVFGVRWIILCFFCFNIGVGILLRSKCQKQSLEYGSSMSHVDDMALKKWTDF